MFETVLDYIARTNLFNFILFVSIIGFIFIKLDVVGSIENAKKSVFGTIKNSEEAKVNSEEALREVENKLSNLSGEIEDIINKSEENANLVGNKMITDANIQVENLRTNSEKLVENRTEILKNDILKRASLASIEVARNQIINELNKNQDLHNKLIDESVEKINGAEL